MSMAKVSEVSRKANQIVNALGSIASLFLPQAAAPVALASTVLSKVAEIDAEAAKESVLGLTATAEALNKMADDLEAGKPIDIISLRELSKNISVIDASLDKFYRVIS